MTVNTIKITSGPYTGNNLSDQYSYDFRVKDKTQLSVYETTDLGVRTLLTVDTDYTVAGIGDAGGGSLTRVAGNLPTDYIWYIRSDYIENQLTAFNSQGGFFPGVHEDQFDHLTFLVQQILDTRNRSFRLSDEVDLDGDFTVDDDAATRASKFLGFDSNGDTVVVAGDLDSLSVSAYMATVILAANAAAARVLLDAANLTVGNTFTAAQIFDAIATFNAIATFDAAAVFNALSTFNEKVIFNKTTHQQIGSDIESASALPNITDGDYSHITAIAAGITGATQANPVVITAVAHGLENGDKVTLADVTGMTEINGIEYTVANKADDTFELSGIDGTGFTAYVSGGSIWVSITSITTTGEVGTIIYREFDGQLVLTHHVNDLILFNDVDIITAAGDVAKFIEYASGDFKLIDYTKVNGEAVNAGTMILLATASASDDATIEFTGIDNTYKNYVVLFDDVIPATDASAFYMRTSSDGGSSFDSGASDYQHVAENRTSLDALFTTTDNAAAFMVIKATAGNATNESVSGVLRLFNPSNAIAVLVSGYGAAIDEFGTHGLLNFSGARMAATDVDAIQFYFSAGNITSGEFQLYGIKDA